jgi:hypothetical protein
MDAADVWLMRLIGALLILFGLVGLTLFATGQTGEAVRWTVFDITAPVLFLLWGLWLFRLAGLRRPVSWSFSLGMLLIFLGLAALALTCDQFLGHQVGSTVFGFPIGAAFLIAGVLTIRRERHRQQN